MVLQRYAFFLEYANNIRILTKFKKKKKLETFVCRFRVKGTVGLEPTVIIFPPICLTNDIDVHWRKVANSLTDGFHLGNGR